MRLFQGKGFMAGFSDKLDGDFFLIDLPEEQAQTIWKNAYQEIKNLSETMLTVFGNSPPRFCLQVHGDSILEVNTGSPVGKQGEGDALITASDEIPIGVFTADCLPILISGGTHVAAIHAGWKGSRLNITGKVIRRFIDEFWVSTDELKIFMGPSIGQCCLELGEEVPPTFFEASPDSPACFSHGKKWHLDLRALNVLQSRREGILPEQITHVQDCTKCQTERYFSYRGQKGRRGSMFSFIMKMRD